MKLSVLTLGCKANQAESFQIQTDLLRQGYKIVDISGRPDICVINTCTVTAKSDYESRQLIRKASKSGAKVIVTGCYSELNKQSVAEMEGVSKVVDNYNKLNIINELSINNTNNDASGLDNPHKSRFFLKVQDGCNFSCTYCIIPRARGRSRSIDIKELVRQVEKISGAYKEAILTGIHLGTYGYDLNPKVTLYDLLYALLQTGIERIRLSSLEITEIDDKLLELMQDSRVCKHLHIPLQSGDDTILKIMNRGYDTKRFAAGMENIQKRLKDPSIGTDVIVGFPGEGEKEFENTRFLIDSLPFTYLHVFPYSHRRGTVASEMPLNITPSTLKDRATVLKGLDKAKKNEFMLRQIGQILDPLIEKQDDSGACLGTTGNYLKVKTVLKATALKNIVRVRVERVEDEFLFGYPINVL